MTKKPSIKRKKAPIHLKNDNEHQDDWMKTLPGYKDELKLHEDLAKKYKAKTEGKSKATIVKKGSYRSGHWGHHGLAGQHGGSLEASAGVTPGRGPRKPRKAKGTVKPKAKAGGKSTATIVKKPEPKEEPKKMSDEQLAKLQPVPEKEPKLEEPKKLSPEESMARDKKVLKELGVSDAAIQKLEETGSLKRLGELGLGDNDVKEFVERQIKDDYQGDADKWSRHIMTNHYLMDEGFSQQQIQLLRDTGMYENTRLREIGTRNDDGSARTLISDTLTDQFSGDHQQWTKHFVIKGTLYDLGFTNDQISTMRDRGMLDDSFILSSLGSSNPDDRAIGLRNLERNLSLNHGSTADVVNTLIDRNSDFSARRIALREIGFDTTQMDRLEESGALGENETVFSRLVHANINVRVGADRELRIARDDVSGNLDDYVDRVVSARENGIALGEGGLPKSTVDLPPVPTLSSPNDKKAQLKQAVQPKLNELAQRKIQPGSDDRKDQVFGTTGSYNRNELQRMWGELNPEGSETTAEDFILDAYENEAIGETGFSSKITTINTSSYEAGGITVEGVIKDEDGTSVGRFTREINRDGKIHHSYFKLDSDQGQGVGRIFYQEAEEAYVAAGMKEVRIGANLTVGGYAWARMGFDYYNAPDTYDRRDVRDRFSDQVKKVVGLSTTQQAYHPDTPGLSTYNAIMKQYNTLKPWEIAAYEYNGVRVGKKALLGSSWSAVKYLNEDDEGFLVGQLYYMSKEKIT